MASLDKPIGGVVGVSLYRKSDVMAVRVADGLCTGIDLCAGAAPLAVPIAEDRSSYTEESVGDEGLPATRHTLTIVCHRYPGRVMFAGPLLEQLATDGALACVELSNGERLLVGWTERLGFEQPLRLKRFRILTGPKPVDVPLLELHLESIDAAHALHYCPA